MKGNMQMKSRTNTLKSLLLIAMLIVTMAFCVTGCKDKDTDSKEDTTEETKIDASKDNVLGKGDTEFTFKVVDKDGNESVFEIHTDEKTVGDALIKLDLLEGEEGDYGLYVKKVNGITADYDKDKTYWAFYIDGEYAMTGVDATDIEEGKTYTFKVEK
ncbi:MAG: DUF4430 domain-containing protein [Lachnospiraceae bacterium]|nr:DUF4430 domain-containing protein [Lachnospiraceae bacterium]